MQQSEFIKRLRENIAVTHPKLPLPEEGDFARLIEEGHIHAPPYYPSEIAEVTKAWKQLCEGQQRMVVPKRYKRWLKARLGWGQRRQAVLAQSHRYKKQLYQLRAKWGIPTDGFLSEQQASAWELVLAGQNESAMKQGAPNEQLPANALKRDCEGLAVEFKVVGDWTIVHRHMLYASAIEDFMVDEGWKIILEEEPELKFEKGATQEVKRHARRLFKAVFKPRRHRKQLMLERDKAYYEAIQSGKHIKDLAKEDCNKVVDEPRAIWRITKALQRFRKGGV